jgi:hypothetical protein
LKQAGSTPDAKGGERLRLNQLLARTEEDVTDSFSDQMRRASRPRRPSTSEPSPTRPAKNDDDDFDSFLFGLTSGLWLEALSPVA